jgi:hypothetical protein
MRCRRATGSPSRTSPPSLDIDRSADFVKVFGDRILEEATARARLGTFKWRILGRSSTSLAACNPCNHVSKVGGHVLHNVHEGVLYVSESKCRNARSAKRSRASPTRAGGFLTILSEDVDWKPFPAFPPTVRLAVVVGQPSEPGPHNQG